MALVPTRRAIQQIALACVWVTVATSPPAFAQPRTFDLQTSSVQDIQDAVAAGALTYERLVQLYLARIDAYNARGPRLNAIIHVNPRAAMDEFAIGSQGLSTLGGQTLNVFDVRRSPGGSSGGTAVAVAAGFATLGIATETGLSTRGPASNAALIGLVPTRGLISRAGIIPLSFTQDRVGIHARSTADAALLLAALKGFDVEDLQTAASLEVPAVGTTPADRGARNPSLRVGVLRELFPTSADAAPAIALVERALSQLRAEATLVDGLTTNLALPSMIPSLRVNNYEVRFAFDAYLRRRGPSSPVKSLAELIASGKYLKDLDSRYDVAMKVQSLDTDVEYRRRLELQRQCARRCWP